MEKQTRYVRGRVLSVTNVVEQLRRAYALVTEARDAAARAEIAIAAGSHVFDEGTRGSIWPQVEQMRWLGRAAGDDVRLAFTELGRAQDIIDEYCFAIAGHGISGTAATIEGGRNGGGVNLRRSVVVSFMAGWQEAPFFYEFDDPEDYNHSIEEAGDRLILSAELVRDLATWDAEYQATYNPDDYRNSGFPSVQAEEAWRERGKVLAERIKRESPVVASVDYRAEGSRPKGWCVF